MAEAANDLVAVVMAGGVGTRFWPLSTPERPKQFHALVGERSLLQLAVDRLVGLVPPERTLVLTQRAFVSHVREHLPQLPVDNVIGEPARRDTAAAVCLGALLARRRFGDPVMLTVTADHLISPVEAFHRAALSAARAARLSSALYTFGIPPTSPATAYGYLELGERIGADDGVEHYRLARFHEKPDPVTARTYLMAGIYLWNSGMFAWTAGSILAEFARHLPGHLEALEQAVAADGTAAWEAGLSAAFEPLPRISVDYAIMEQATDVRCVRSSFSWSDVGGWIALGEHLEADRFGNRRHARLHVLDAEDNLVFAEDPEEIVALVGVRDLVVVRAGRRTLVVHRDRAEEVKALVESLPTDDGDPDPRVQR